MDIRKVKKLIEMLEESQLNEVKLKKEKNRKTCQAISVPVQNRS